jgi:alcohol dehydrogenase
MRLAGICNTDLELHRGYYDFSGIPGHEFVADVVSADQPFLIGMRVAGEINLACGSCEFCNIGLQRHCANRTVLGIVRHPGAFAELLTLPEENLHVLPDNISDEEAVFIEPLAAACEILDQVAIPSGAPVAVLGDGKLGLLIAQVLHVHGARVMLYGHHDQKLAIAKRMGISGTTSTDMPEQAYPFVVECTGSSHGLRQAVGMTRSRGTVILKSTVHNQVSLDTAPVIVKEISLIGSRCGRFKPAIDLLNAKVVDVKPLISAEFPLSQAVEAFAEAQRKDVLKVLLRNDSETEPHAHPTEPRA